MEFGKQEIFAANRMTEHQPATVPASSTSVNMKETAFLMPLAFLFYICNIRNRFGLSTRHINGYGHAAASNQKNPCFEVLGIPYALPQLRDLKTETKANHVHVDSKDPELCTVLLNDGGVDDNDESDSHEHKITPIGSYNETHSFVATDNMEWNDVQPRFSRHTKEIKWIRLSQFPYVPPFIKFCQHNEECEYLLPTEVKTKLKWRLSKITHFALRETISSTGFQLLENTTEWTGQWEKYTKTNMSQAALKDYQKVNHIPATFELGRKDRLWQNFKRYSIKFGLENFGFMSKSYILPQEMESFKQAWDTYPKGIPWIIKPPAGSNSNGIHG